MKTRPPHGKRRAIWPSLSFSVPLVEPLSILELSPPQITIIAAIRGPTAARSLRSPLPPSSSSPAAGIMKVATSSPARPLTPLSLSLGPPSRRCIVRLLSWMGAAAKGPPACVRDDNALEARRHRKEGRKKETRQSLREEEDVEEREVEQKGPPPGNEYG